MPAGGTHVDVEIDLTVRHRLHHDVAVGGGVGRLFAGGFVEANSAGGSTTYPYLLLEYRF